MTLFPGQKGRLSEYAEMLASNWSGSNQITVLAQKDPAPEKFENIEVLSSFNPENPLSLLNTVREIRQINPDVVVFNQSIGVWGQGKITNAVGMALPGLVRSLGYPTFTVLHNVYEEMDVEKIDRAENSFILDIGVKIGTYCLLAGSNVTSVTLERYRESLDQNYHVGDVIHIPHGVPVNDFTYSAPGDKINLLAFGHWSPNKRLPLIIKAFQELENANLTVAGEAHPDYPGYLDDIREKYDVSGVDFTGYVEEENVGDVFSDADLVLLPYDVCVGTSGVLNLAVGYGVPVLATRTYSMENIAREEGAEIFFTGEQPGQVASRIKQLHQDPGKLEEVARRNYEAAETKSFRKICARIEEELENLTL